MKKLLILILIFQFAMASVYADANWKMHVNFDESVNHVIETPQFVYFTSRTLPASERLDPVYSLFRYDKQGDEIQSLSTDNLLSTNNVHDIMFNPSKGYLIVLHSNSDIDLLYDNGKVVNIPYYKQSSPGYSKLSNSISIDPDHDRFYLATDFGYVAVNDKKGEIAESRIYGEPLQSFCRMGDNYFAIRDSVLIYAPVSDYRMSLEDYSEVENTGKVQAIYPLSPSLSVITVHENDEDGWYVKLLGMENGQFEITDGPSSGYLYNIEYNSDGITIPTGNTIYQIFTDGRQTSLHRPSGFNSISASTDDRREVWFGAARKGLSSSERSNDAWKLTRDYMMPNSPAVFITSNFTMHPSKGLLVAGYPHDYNLGSYPSLPLLVNSYSGGRWQNFSPVYHNANFKRLMTDPNGLSIDPDNPSYVYFTSRYNGLLRINLSDPDDILHLSAPSDRGADCGGFVAFIDDQTGPNAGTCNLSVPLFDNQGNMWMSYADYDDQDSPAIHLYCWLAQDRRSSTDASNVIVPKRLLVPGVKPNNLQKVVPVKYTGRGLLLYVKCNSIENLVLIDTNSTPLDSSDDTVYIISEFYDQDNNPVNVLNTHTIFEDPNTGLVWIGHQEGVFYFRPADVIQGNKLINRVKVARNDGTNLADYLLDGVTVNQITSDNAGRLWFATKGGGVVCTTSDGREIVMEFNTSNSPLPDDVVFGIGYNSDVNSMMISTADGLAEYFLPGNSSSTEKKDVRAYPNPVRPEYSGYVTITDIPEGSLVKISDASGNLVKELGTVSGFDIQWDITDTHFRRVGTGVYYILVSPGTNEGSSFSAVGKILVVS